MLFSYINTPSTFVLVHPPTPNNRYNNALIIKSFEITDNSKAATLKKTIAFVQRSVVYLGILGEC